MEDRIFPLVPKGRVATGSRVVSPYYHTIPHNLRAVARKLDIDLVFKNDFRLDVLTPFEESDIVCKNHENKFVKCQSNIVYVMLLACGCSYIGQSETCLNDRLREHALKV